MTAPKSTFYNGNWTIPSPPTTTNYYTTAKITGKHQKKIYTFNQQGDMLRNREAKVYGEHRSGFSFMDFCVSGSHFLVVSLFIS